MLILALAIIIAAYLRFSNTALDRDYAPYAYPAVNKTGYLQAGHHDIKPPLIHWSYKLWTRLSSFSTLPLTASLRLLAAIGISLATGCIAISHPAQGLVIALLLSSPTLWNHMANTEWLTVTLLALSVAISTGLPTHPELAFLVLGLLPWANQKNALLIAPVAWALGLTLSTTHFLALCGPSVLFGAYLVLTGRAKTFWQHCFVAPSKMGKARTLKQNTLGHLHLLKPGIILMAPFIATMDFSSPWAAIFFLCIGISVWSKQIVPHHYLLWAFPLALASRPGIGAFVAFAIVWAFRDLAIWLRPSNIYRITFGGAQGDYGMRLEDGEWVAHWLRERGAKEIWVNGMDNNIYLSGPFKAWNMVVPEWTEKFEGKPPKYIVHGPGAIEFDYDGNGYQMVESTSRGSYILMERK